MVRRRHRGWFAVIAAVLVVGVLAPVAGAASPAGPKPAGAQDARATIAAAGNAYNLYLPGAPPAAPTGLGTLPWNDLRSPNNASSGPAGISHWFICMAEVPVPTTPENPTTNRQPGDATTSTTPAKPAAPRSPAAPDAPAVPADSIDLDADGFEVLPQTGAQWAATALSGLALLITGTVLLAARRRRT